MPNFIGKEALELSVTNYGKWAERDALQAATARELRRALDALFLGKEWLIDAAPTPEIRVAVVALIAATDPAAVGAGETGSAAP